MECIVQSEGARIWTIQSGHPKRGWVLLCNGGPGCCDYLSPVAEMVEDEYAVIRFEQRGCGRSEKDGRYDVHTALNDMESIRNHYGIGSLIVGGHSWGANLALAYLLKYPEVAGGLLYLAGNGVQRNREWSDAYHTNRAKFGERMPDMAYEGSDIVNAQCNRSWQQYIQRPALYREIADIRAPALFLTAGKDVRPNWPAEQLHQLVEGSKLVCVEEAAHYIWLTHPDDMKRELRAFLRIGA